MAAPVIESVFPGDTQTGVPLGIDICIVFDTEIDPVTLEHAFIFEGNDSDRWTGPDLQIYDSNTMPKPEIFLDSPGYKGLVHGEWTFEKLTADGLNASGPTYSPGSSPFKTKACFSPYEILATNYIYRCYIAGDDFTGDDFKVGLSSRTVSDTMIGPNTGTGNAIFTGGYIGPDEDTIVVEITMGGSVGNAQYSWYRQSAPIDIRTGTVSEQERHLFSGLTLSFTKADYAIGDVFTVKVTPPVYTETTYTWTFTTGSGSIESLPSTTSTSVLGDVGVPAPVIPFSVESSSPSDNSINNSVSSRRITITFSEDLDPATITEESVVIDILPALGITYDKPGRHNVPKILSVIGNTLTIQL